MNRVTVGIVSNNRRLRFAYRLLLEQESKSDVEVLWDALFGNDLQMCRRCFGQPNVLLVDYDEMLGEQILQGLEDLRCSFPNSRILFIYDDRIAHTGRYQSSDQYRLISKNCTVQTLLSAIFKIILENLSSLAKEKRRSFLSPFDYSWH